MKILLILLFTLSVLKGYSQKDTLGVISTTSRSGVFNFDTLRVVKNSQRWFNIKLNGGGSAVKEVLISNDNGTYSIKRNLTTVSYVGASGTSWGIYLENNYVVVKVNWNNIISNWKLQIQ
jgi:hypothetical protein